MIEGFDAVPERVVLSGDGLRQMALSHFHTLVRTLTGMDIEVRPIETAPPVLGGVIFGEGLPDLTDLSDEAILTGFGEVLADRKRLDEYAQQLVDEARSRKVTWEKIGKVAGVRPQTAYQHWSKKGREKHRQYTSKWRSETEKNDN